jgi:hypothetical protein
MKNTNGRLYNPKKITEQFSIPGSPRNFCTGCIETEKMVDANLMACELFKITMDEALNIRVEDFASGIPDKQALVKLEEVLKGKSQRFKTHLFDKKDRKFPVEICAKQIIIRDRDCVLINIREIDDR